MGTTFAGTRHGPWALNTLKMSQPQKYFGVFRAQGTCSVAANVVLPVGRVTALPISLPNIWGHFEVDESRGRKGAEGMGKTQ